MAAAAGMDACVHGGLLVVELPAVGRGNLGRLQQRGAAWSRCDMLEEKELLVSQLKAHRNLLQSLWSYVDTAGGRKGSEAAQEPKRWYAGAKGQRQQRPVTGITEQLLGKRRRTAKSFTALIPKPQEGLTMGFTPEDTGLKSKSGLRHQRRSSPAFSSSNGPDQFHELGVPSSQHSSPAGLIWICTPRRRAGQTRCVDQ